jgi:hypothetical protein
MTKIGDTLYRYMRENENRSCGRGKMMPLWQEEKIFGESPTHWYVGFKHNPWKVRKKTLFSAGVGGYTGHQWYTSEGKDDRVWSGRHMRGILRVIEYGNISVEKLKQIAKIIGYKENEK